MLKTFFLQNFLTQRFSLEVRSVRVVYFQTKPGEQTRKSSSSYLYNIWVDSTKS